MPRHTGMNRKSSRKLAGPAGARCGASPGRIEQKDLIRLRAEVNRHGDEAVGRGVEAHYRLKAVLPAGGAPEEQGGDQARAVGIRGKEAGRDIGDGDCAGRDFRRPVGDCDRGNAVGGAARHQ